MSVISGLRMARLQDNRWLVVNPVTATAFKVNEATHTILEAMQAGKDLDSAYEASSLKDEICKNDFARAMHLIEVRVCQANDGGVTQMSWGIWIVSPAIMGSIAQNFTWLLNPRAFWVNVALAIGLVAAFQTSTILHGPINYSTGLASLALVILSVAFHEIGHCAAMIRNERVVGRLGVGITMIFPAFFTNVLEHEVMTKREKLEVDASGVYFQLVFANLLLLTGAVSQSSTIAGTAVIVLTLGAFQLLPIGTLDGHWILQDILNGRCQKLRKCLIAVSYLLIMVLLTRLAYTVLIPFWISVFKGGLVGSHGFTGSSRSVLSGLFGTIVCLVWTVSFGKKIASLTKRVRPSAAAVNKAAQISKGDM